MFTLNGWHDYCEWHHPQHKKLFGKLNKLIDEISRSPFEGTGKPEPLKHELSGWWSRQIDQEHRIVYMMDDDGGSDDLVVASCRFHY